MNRNEEFAAILMELDQPAPDLKNTVNRAYKKRKRKTAKYIYCPLGTLTAVFATFVLLVNLSATVANACAQVPVLCQLAETVIFSRSLSAAVENDYVQTINLEQTQNDITAKIEYLIVDQKQVNIFYRLTSEKHNGKNDKLIADPVISCDDENLSFYVYNYVSAGENGELLCATVDFTQGSVPKKLQCTLKVYSYYEAISQQPSDSKSRYLAELNFDLKFDPQFTVVGKIYPVNETVILGEQSITVTNIEVYPTHLRVEVTESEDNTAWLKNLYFYIETDQGMKFEPVSSGVTATGTSGSPSMVSYRADSTYFYEAEHLKLVITGAKWQRKDIETTYLNLVTGEHSKLPDGVEFESIQKQGDDWSIKIRDIPGENGEMHQTFSDVYLDSAGNKYTTNEYHFTIGKLNKDGSVQCFYSFVKLRNYPYDEVWLTPQHSLIWTAEQPIEIAVQ